MKIIIIFRNLSDGIRFFMFVLSFSRLCRGVAVDDQGYICVADSGNNRIQIFHPDGSFLRAFGSWGSGDAEFKGLEGVAIMSNGNILVCDRENHRVQVF
jgi:tripartite motif-containing protein 71